MQLLLPGGGRRLPAGLAQGGSGRSNGSSGCGSGGWSSDGAGDSRSVLGGAEGWAPAAHEACSDLHLAVSEEARAALEGKLRDKLRLQQGRVGGS